MAELRSRVAETRFRLPDVCALLNPPKTKYLADAAYLVIEVLSERDAMSEVLERLEDFRRKGVGNIWLIDPRRKTMAVYSRRTLQEVEGDAIMTEDQQVWLSRSEIFAE